MNTNYSHTDIDELLHKYVAGTSSQEENQYIMQWIKADAGHLNYLQQFRNASKILDHSNLVFDANNALANFDRSLKNKKLQKLRNIMLWVSSAAAVLVLFWGLKVFVFNNEAVLHELASATDSVRAVDLVDGSTVTLNKNAKLFSRDQFTAQNRELELDGEGFFEVAHDPEHPFVVYVNSVAVKVKGTSFNILSDSLQNVIVTVKTGRVEVSNSAESLVITQGQQVTFCASEQVLTESSTDVVNCDSWKTGELVFNQTELKKVIQSLNQHLSASFVLGSEQLAERKLNARFDTDESVEDVEEILSVVLGVTIINEKGNRVIYAKD